jgi:hypothetical protein
LFLKKKVIHNDLMTHRLGGLPIAEDAKQLMREKLSTIASYRQAVGEAYFAEDGTFMPANPSADTTWRGAIGRLGETFLSFTEDMVFRTRMDGVLKLAVINSLSLDEVYDMENVAERWSQIETKVQAAPPTTVEEEEADFEVQDIPQEMLAEKDADLRKPAAQEAIREGLKEAQKVVAAGVRLLDGSEKDSSLMEQLKSSPLARLGGDDSGYVVIVYDVKASGEDAKFNLNCRAPPLRKAHAPPLAS